MIASKQDLEYVLEKLNIQEIENKELLNKSNGGCFTINVNLDSKIVELTMSGDFLFIEICFITDFKNVIEKKSYKKY